MVRWDMSRNRQVKRQWTILKFLARNRYATLELIANHCGCCEKSIRRDLAALEDVGFPIHWISNADDGGKFIRLDRDWLQLNGGHS